MQPWWLPSAIPNAGKGLNHNFMSEQNIWNISSVSEN